MGENGRMVKPLFSPPKTNGLKIPTKEKRKSKKSLLKPEPISQKREYNINP